MPGLSLPMFWQDGPMVTSLVSKEQKRFYNESVSNAITATTFLEFKTHTLATSYHKGLVMPPWANPLQLIKSRKRYTTKASTLMAPTYYLEIVY